MVSHTVLDILRGFGTVVQTTDKLIYSITITRDSQALILSSSFRLLPVPAVRPIWRCLYRPWIRLLPSPTRTSGVKAVHLESLAKLRVVERHYPKMSAQPEAPTSAVLPIAPTAPLTRSEEVNTFSSPNLLGTLGAFTRLSIPNNGRFMHPLAPEPATPASVPPVSIGQIPNDDQSTLDLAKRFISLLPEISYSLNSASTYPINDARVLSLYKEGSQQEHITLKVRSTMPEIPLVSLTLIQLLYNRAPRPPCMPTTL